MSILTAEEPVTDAAGDIFDPEIHATKPNGEPSMKTDGTFRKKRRDAGGARSSAAPKKSASAAGVPKALQEQHARHVRGIRDAAALPLTVLSFVDPVDAYCVSELVDPFADALATVAQDQPQLAAMLDKLSGSGAVATALGIAAVGVIQVLHNHGKVPASMVRMMGGKPRHEIEAILRQRGEAMAAAQAADEQRAAAA